MTHQTAFKAAAAVGTAVILLLVIGPLFLWFCCRIEPDNGEVAVLIHKTGLNLPEGEIIAPDDRYKGIQLEVLGEGRYFRNPYSWDWEIIDVTDIPAGKFAVLVRKFGKTLPEGEIVAPGREYKGIVREVLGTGKHRINPYAYDVKLFDDLKIRPGHIGIVTALCGDDLFSGTANDFDNHHGFLVAPGRKGVLREVLKEGTHRINPFLKSVAIVNTQSQRHEFSGDDAISFFTVDGFKVSLEGTVEFNINPDEASRLANEVGNLDDILNKLILPNVHGFARIEGSKKTATEFIVGESRQIFQKQLDNYLKQNCSRWGISINSVLIRDIIPPQEIAEIIRNRELAQQEARKFRQQIEQAKSDAELKRQEKLALQNRNKVDAETVKLTAEIAARQEQLERTIAARTELEIAETDYRTMQAQTEAALKIAEAERQVIAARNRSEAEVLQRNLDAYGGGENFIRARLYEKIAPGLTSIMINSDGADASIFGLPLLAAPSGAPDKHGDNAR